MTFSLLHGVLVTCTSSTKLNYYLTILLGHKAPLFIFPSLRTSIITPIAQQITCVLSSQRYPLLGHRQCVCRAEQPREEEAVWSLRRGGFHAQVWFAVLWVLNKCLLSTIFHQTDQKLKEQSGPEVLYIKKIFFLFSRHRRSHNNFYETDPSHGFQVKTSLEKTKDVREDLG